MLGVREHQRSKGFHIGTAWHSMKVSSVKESYRRSSLQRWEGDKAVDLLIDGTFTPQIAKSSLLRMSAELKHRVLNGAGKMMGQKAWFASHWAILRANPLRLGSSNHHRGSGGMGKGRIDLPLCALDWEILALLGICPLSASAVEGERH